MTDWKTLTGGKYFITDLGESPTVSLPGAPPVVMGRYAVWAPIPNTDRHRVIEVSSDLHALRAKYGLESAPVFSLVHNRKE